MEIDGGCGSAHDSLGALRGDDGLLGADKGSRYDAY